MARVPEFLTVEHAKGAMVIQDSGFRADEGAIALPASIRRPGFACILEVSTFQTLYPKEKL